MIVGVRAWGFGGISLDYPDTEDEDETGPPATTGDTGTEPDGTTTLEPSDDSDGSSDGTDGGTGQDTDGGGCSCRTSSTGGSTGWLVLLAGLRLRWRRRAA